MNKVILFCFILLFSVSCSPVTKNQPQADTKTNAMDALLKDLGDSPQTSKGSKIASKSGTMTQQEFDDFRDQLAKCLNPFTNKNNTVDVKVELALIVNRDRTIRDIRAVDINKYHSNQSFRNAADFAMDALRKSDCKPLKLPQNKYNEWHQMTIVFDPKAMF